VTNGLVSLNSKIISSAEALINPLTSVLYGKGVFTTVAIYKGKPFLWEKHWRRVTRNAEFLGIDLTNSAERPMRDALDELIEANSIGDGRARITFFDESPSSVWQVDTQKKTSVLIMTGDRRPVPHDFRVQVSQSRISSFSKTAGIKSCNYLDNLLAYEETARHGFQEAIRLNERGEVTSACMANIFWIEGEKLFTPSLTTGCLPGTTREFVLENVTCEEVKAGAELVHRADAIFLTSAGLGVTRVSEFDGRRLGGENHAILQLMPKTLG